MSRNAKFIPTCVTGSPVAPDTGNSQWNLGPLKEETQEAKSVVLILGTLLLSSFYSNSVFIVGTKPLTDVEQGCFSSWCITRRFERPCFIFLLCCRWSCVRPGLNPKSISDAAPLFWYPISQKWNLDKSTPLPHDNVHTKLQVCEKLSNAHCIRPLIFNTTKLKKFILLCACNCMDPSSCHYISTRV